MSERTSFVQLLVGFLLSAAGAHASCPIELSPPSVVVRYGDPVSINCSASESLFAGMSWEASQGGTGLELVKHLTWTVKRLTDWAISPSCFFTPSQNSSFEQCSINPKVVLYTFPETISIISSSDSDGVMREKEEHSITCEIQKIAPVQNLTVRWYKGDTIFHTDTFNNPSKEPVNQSSVHSFRPTGEDNGVTFRCEAHLDLGPEGPQLNVSSQEYNITVNFGPHILCSAPELLEGETLEKKCPVTGNPTPSVKWLKDGQHIDPTAPMSRQDAGVYTIDAVGIHPVKITTRVRVLYGPELMCPSTYTTLEHAPHNLTCTVNGNPQPVMTWYKDGAGVELPENLTRRDGGQYLITASNSLSTVNVTVDITVIYPPSQIVELEDSEVDVGSTVLLKCSSMGNPRPKYSWNYYRTDNVMEKNKDGVSHLTIDNATVYNMGSYTCHAWNDRGNVSKTVRVTVKEIADSVSIRPVHNSSSVVEEREFQLQCDITNVAPARNLAVRWYRGNKTIEPLIKASMRMTGCLSPVNVSSTISVILNRKQSGAEFRCGALLDLGPEGPQPPPNMMSSPLKITVNYPPSQIVELEDSEVVVGSTVRLKCSSMGNPRPKYSWNYHQTHNVMEKNEDGVTHLTIDNATVYNMGSYTCHAWNDRGNVSKTVRVTVKGAEQDCPIKITPDRMVIQYQSRGQNATCTPTSTGSMNDDGEIYWQVQQGIRTNGTRWFVDTHKDWDPRPVCTATFKGIGTCRKHLSFTLYKTPDTVSIRSVHNSSSVVEEREFQLQCDITNVAPARNLAVRWYRGNETFKPPIKSSMQVTGCLSPVNVSSTISLTLNRKQNGAEFKCEALLDLGPEGPQPPPNMMSSPLNIIVYYKPIINTTKLRNTIPVFRGYPEELVCEADGYPPPKIQWLYNPDKGPHVSGDTLTVFEAGFYICSATNEVDSVSFEVEVILKEYYLPLIAGFVAVAVVAIFIVCHIICFVCYKNTKKRRYSLQNLQFPMIRLS